MQLCDLIDAMHGCLSWIIAATLDSQSSSQLLYQAVIAARLHEVQLPGCRFLSASSHPRQSSHWIVTMRCLQPESLHERWGSAMGMEQLRRRTKYICTPERHGHDPIHNVIPVIDIYTVRITSIFTTPLLFSTRIYMVFVK